MRDSMSVLRISRCLQPCLASLRVDSCVRLHDCSILFRLPPPTALPTGEGEDSDSLITVWIPYTSVSFLNISFVYSQYILQISFVCVDYTQL